MNKKVAILGSKGNVGKIITHYCAQAGDLVTAFSRVAPQYNQQNVTNAALNYDDQEAMNRVFREFDVVIVTIAIAYGTKPWQEKWPKMADSLAVSIRQGKARCVFFDNVYSYGLRTDPMTEETPMQPTSEKGKVRKYVDEVFLKLISEGHSVVLAKSADFYGPDVDSSTMSRRFHDQLAKGTFEWVGDPAIQHSYTYVPDMAPALYELAHASTVGNYHLPTSNEQITGNSIKDILQQHTGKTYKTSAIRPFMARVIGLFMPIMRELQEMLYQYENPYIFDSSKILTEFPNLKVTPLKQGIIDQYEWYQSHPKQA